MDPSSEGVSRAESVASDRCARWANSARWFIAVAWSMQVARTGSGFTVDVALHVVGLAATSWLFWNTAMYGAVTRQEPDSFFLRGLLRTHELSTDDVAPVSRTPFGYTVGLTRCSKTLQPLRLTTGPRPTSSMCPTTEPERK